MALPRRQAANQRNAQKSTGPTTKAGKAKSSMNATRHGLSARTVYDEETIKHIDALAKEFLCATGKDSAAMCTALVAAEAQIQLERTQTLKSQVYQRNLPPRQDALNQDLSNSHPTPHIESEGLIHFTTACPSPHTHNSEVILAISESAKRLHALIRYERQFSNRRDQALQALTEHDLC